MVRKIDKAESNIFKNNNLCDQKFTKISLEGVEVEDKIFENCCFHNSSFIKVKFTNCKFIECDFKVCNLSTASFKNTFFVDTVFIGSKLLGINWTELKWPYVQLDCPFKFYESDISHSNFYSLKLNEIVIANCKALNVDFRKCKLSSGDLSATDFEGSLFMHTDLSGADLTQAVNYRINPNENKLDKGKYSFPEVINLLHDFDIEIQGI